MKKVRVGIVGCGGIANAHVNGYAANSDVELVAFFDTAPANAEKFMQKFGGKVYDSLDNMYSSDTLDAISVCTPPVAHKDTVIAALDKGINVLCEKPLAISVDDSKEMVEKANKTGKFLMTAFAWRFHKEIQRTKQLISEGKIGKVVMVRNSFAGYADMSQKWFSKKEISGGGCFIDAGIHSIDIYRYIFGDIKNVWAKMRTVASSLQVEDIARVMVETPEGIVGSIDISWSTGIGPGVCLEVYGTEGTIEVMWSSMRYRTRTEKEWTVEETKTPEDNPFRLETKHFVDVILGKTQPIVNGIDGMKAMEVTEAVYQSAKTNIWQPVKG
ncbi:MAG: Gfo/Idh/MocA family oxidoreductase [Elusimicrobiota bacterium]